MSGTIGTAIIVGIFSVLSAAVGVLGQKVLAASKKSEAEAAAEAQKFSTAIDTRGEEWPKILAEVRAVAAAQVDSLRAEVASQGEAITRLRGEVSQLRAENERMDRDNREVQGKYRASLRYARAWRLLHPESITKVDVPIEIEVDL